MKVESGMLFTELFVNYSQEDLPERWEWVKLGIDLNEVIDGDVYCVNIPFDVFTELLIKFKNTYRGVNN